MGLDKAVPFLLESGLKEPGTSVVNAANISVQSIRDGIFVTGQNPHSSAHNAGARG